MSHRQTYNCLIVADRDASPLTKKERRALDKKTQRENMAKIADKRLFGKDFQDDMASINAEYFVQRDKTLASLERTRKLLGITS